MVLGRLISALDRPVDAASTAAFRALFGGVMLLSTARFLGHGWIREYYGAPRYFFHYWGFSWVRPLPAAGMYCLYAGLALAALCIALGFAYRAAALFFTLGFSYAHLCDKTNYLNHYYLVSLVGCLFVVLPLDREWSLRARRNPDARCGRIRAWALYLLRFQIGVVYVFGGIGKLGSDWLVHGEPLRIWLAANAEMPVLGRLLALPWAGLAFSWAGALFDLSVVPLLSWRRTRGYVYVAVVGFHVLTALLFRIGMFPWIMIVSATLFFDASWPRRWLARFGLRASAPLPGIAGERLRPWAQLAAAAYALTQALLPLRSELYPGNTLWSEEGFRFAWKVMLIEKAGVLAFNVVDAAGRPHYVAASDYLTELQTRMASTQPDMILELSQIIARDFAARGYGAVQVYADAEVSFNGRLRSPLVDPKVDLAKESDSLRAKSWILPAPRAASAF